MPRSQCASRRWVWQMPHGVTAGFCPPVSPGQWEGRVIKFACVKGDIPAEWGERRVWYNLEGGCHILNESVVPSSPVEAEFLCFCSSIVSWGSSPTVREWFQSGRFGKRRKTTTVRADVRLSSAKMSENGGVTRLSGSAQVFLLDSPTPPSRGDATSWGARCTLMKWSSRRSTFWKWAKPKTN